MLEIQKLNRILNSDEKIYCFYYWIVLTFYPLLYTFNQSYQEYTLTAALWCCLFLFVFFNYSLAIVGAVGLSFTLAYNYNIDQTYFGNDFGSHDRILLGWMLFFFSIKHFFIKDNLIFPKQSLALVLLSSVLFSAGLSKLINSGFSWSTSENIQNILMFRYIVSGNQNAFNLAQLPTLCLLGGISILIFQLGSLMICRLLPWLFCFLASVFLLIDYFALDIRLFLICLLPNILSFIHLSRLNHVHLK